MPNELLFLIQIFLILIFSFVTLKLGKNALITGVCVQAILANLLVLKQMSFFGFHVTCSDAFVIGSILGLNLLREYWGQQAAKKAISICFFFMLFFVLFTQLHLRFTPSMHDTTQDAYHTLLSQAPRLLLASLTCFFLIQNFDLRFFGWLSKKFSDTPFALRSSASLIISQFIDTLLFSFLALWGHVAKLGHIILISYLIKVSIIFLLGPLTALLKKFSPSKNY